MDIILFVTLLQDFLVEIPCAPSFAHGILSRFVRILETVIVVVIPLSNCHLLTFD